MDQVLVNYPIEQFPKYEKEDAGKPVLNGDTGKQKIMLKFVKFQKEK
jgi:hypothetical protein